MNLQGNVIELLQLLERIIDSSLRGCHYGPLYPAGGWKLQSVCTSNVGKLRKENRLPDVGKLRKENHLRYFAHSDRHQQRQYTLLPSYPYIAFQKWCLWKKSSTSVTVHTKKEFIVIWFFFTVHHCRELFHQPTLMNNFLYSLTICFFYTIRSQPVYCADVYRGRRYQMLCEENFFSWRWAC